MVHEREAIVDGSCSVRLWYRTGDVAPLSELARDMIVCLDVETPGLDPHVDEVLQIALVRGDDEVLLSRHVRPEHHSSWPSAQRTHGVSPSMVAGCPSLVSLKGEIEKVFENVELVVGYNVAFDLSFLRAAGISIGNVSVFDVMREFAPVVGRWDTDRQRYSWVPLAYCAKYYGVSLRAHDALDDARATLACFLAMIGADSGESRPMPYRSYLDIVARYSRAKAYRRSGQDEWAHSSN